MTNQQVALISSVFLRVNGSYEALIGGRATEGFEDFTGGVAESYELSKAPPHLFKLMQKALKLRSLMGCSISVSLLAVFTPHLFLQRNKN